MPARYLPLFLAVGLLWPAARLSAADAPTVVLAVRHAEKASATAEDPSLSLAGQRRAHALAHAVGTAGVDAIYVTQFKRTQETVAPLAAKLRLTPIQHPAKDTAGLVDAIRTKWSGQTVVVSGHSNTVNEVVKALTGTPVDELPDEQFDNLFVIVLPPGGPGQFTQLKYGAPTPEGNR